jgi:hypothetical protein
MEIDSDFAVLEVTGSGAQTLARRQRRYAVLSIIRNSIMPARMFDGKALRLGRGVRPRMEARRATVSRVFLDAYGDETGAEYWRAWIDGIDPDPDEKIALLLATHVVAENEGMIGKDRNNSFDWRARSEIRSRANKRCKDALNAISKNRSLRERIHEMAADPNNEDLLPPSLRRFLSPLPIVAALPADSVDKKSPKKAFGRPFAADWLAIRERVKDEIKLVGFPDKKGTPGWRSQADVVRFIEELTGDDNPGKTALKENAKKMLADIRTEIRAEMDEKSESPSRP